MQDWDLEGKKTNLRHFLAKFSCLNFKAHKVLLSKRELEENKILLCLLLCFVFSYDETRDGLVG